MHERPMPEIRELPADAIPNPPVDDDAVAAELRADQMRTLARREAMQEVQIAATLAMRRNPYPDNRQGRRRWARELQKLAIHGAR